MSAKLLCVEKVNQDTREAQYDRVIYNDNRVLKNLLLQQDISLPRFNYFKQIQSDIQPYMRKVVANWMMEVCEDQRCEVQVFPLAMNLMDRFLCTHDVKKCQLQLTGATCLLIASKTRQCIQIPVHLLCHYTENSITPNDLRDWEMLIMSKLRWKVYAVTGCDFIEHLLQELDVSNDSRIRDHAHTLLALACTDSDLIFTRSSILACSAIVSAIRGLRRNITDLNNRLEAVTGVTNNEIEDTVQIIESAFYNAFKTFTDALPNENCLKPAATTFDLYYVR